MKKKYYARRRRRRRKATTRFYVLIGVLVVALGVGIYFIVDYATNQPGEGEIAKETMTLPDAESIPSPMIPDDDESVQPTPPPDMTPLPDIGLLDGLIPAATDETNPDNFGFETAIMNDGETDDSFTRDETITFGTGEEYTSLEGVITFRGNNYRDAASWGTVPSDITGELELIDTRETGSIGGKGGAWWTGQPLIVNWPSRELKNMNDMFVEAFQGRDELVEVIYASMSGYIYFNDLETGEKTREAIFFGAPIKGTASLDPRGYPIIYVGQGLPPDGDSSGGNCQDMYFKAFSLIDGELLMKFGAPSRDPFAPRRDWQAYDSSALIDGETDTLIAPGENGVLYTCKLNTEYDAEAGTVSMDLEEFDPIKVKYRYTSTRNVSANRWGMENSAVAWREYLIFTDNIGMLQCVNLNTMELVYANDLSDDSDVSMVLEEDLDNNTFYLYTGCEYDEVIRPYDGSGTAHGTAYARKIDGLTGEIIEEAKFECYATGDVDGGILASPVLGRDGTDMEGLIIYNITYEVENDEATDRSSTSRLVALDKNTFEEVWSYDMEVKGWSPSSPVPVYTEDGKGYIVQCDKAGDVALVDGATGKEVDKLALGTGDNFEASPAVYNDMIVVASKSGRHIFFIKIK